MSHAPPGYHCPFCRYGRGEFNATVGPDHVVERTAETLTFVSPKWWPNNSGHLLVIPTGHYESLYELPDSLAAPLQRAARNAALALKLAYRCDGISTRQHNEPAGDQDVWHFHLHVFPRYSGDGLYGTQGEFVEQAAMLERAVQLRAVYAKQQGG